MFELTEMQQGVKSLARELAEGELLTKVKRTIDGHEQTMELRKALDEHDEYPLDFIKKLGAQGLLSVFIPEKYSGAGEGMLGLCLAKEEIARVCPAASTAYGANALGALPILISGTEEQKQRYLPKIATGENLGAFGLTESGAGSDALAMKTLAVLAGDRYVLNGEKIFISNAGQADIYSVFVVTNPDRGARGISGFIVEKGTSGLSFGKKEKKMGLHASETRSLIFSNCNVPKANLLGEREGLGAITLLKTLNFSRIGVGSQAVGAAQGAFEAALAYAKERKQFGKPIFEFQVIAHKLANMKTLIEAARALVHKAAWYADHEGDKDTIAKFGAMAKCFASDMAMHVATEAVQICGGNGYMREYPVEKFMRDVKVFQIYEGTNEIQREEITKILIKESSNFKATEISETGHAKNAEAEFYKILNKQKSNHEYFKQHLQHRFADLAMKLESAKALVGKANELKDANLSAIACSYSSQVVKELATELAFIDDGFYSQTDGEQDKIAAFLNNSRLK